MIGDAINDFRVYNHRAKGNYVRDKFANFNAPKKYCKSTLLVERNAISLEPNRQRILIYFLV